MKYHEITPHSIKQLMDIFYAKVRADQSGLGAIFNHRIGKDNAHWDAHKQKIANFWESMLLGSKNYSGQPLKAHLDLDPFPREFFATWLNLFSSSLEEIFDEQCKTLILQRAQMIAQRFQYMLYESGYH